MKKYRITEVYDEKVVVTSTNSFDEAVLAYQDQIGGKSKPADRVLFCVWWKGHYILIADKEL